MALDIWIYGPSYGETIVMAWDDPANTGQKRFSVVDHYGGRSFAQSPALTRWLALRTPVMAFVAATHPHFDHIRGLHSVLAVAGAKENLLKAAAPQKASPISVPPQLERIFCWGSCGDPMTQKYYQAIVEHSPIRKRELVSAASMASQLLSQTRTLAGLDGSSNPGSARFIPMMGNIPSEQHDCGGVTVTAIGPWEIPKQRYDQAFKNQFRTEVRDGKRRTVVNPDRVQANRTSLGLLIEYGDAQIVLGGDMEEENWNAWHQQKRGKLRPSVVKVSHHGSPTGLIPGMWDGRGFFGSHEGVTDTDEMPICVVTPWRRGARSRQLPESNTLDKIRASGCRLVVTGSPANGRGLDSGNWYCDSFVHIVMEKDGNATVKESRLCNT